MTHTFRQFLLAGVLLLAPGLAAAMVVNGGVISGLPPNSVVEVDFGLGAPSTATVNQNGEVIISGEEDDDDGTLYFPANSDGTFEVREQATGASFGALTVAGAEISVASGFAGAGAQSSIDFPVRIYLIGEVLAYEQDDLDTSVGIGSSLATTDGFTVRSDADTNGYGGSLGLGLMFGDGKPWHSAGSLQGHVSVSYTWYEDRDGQFTASMPGITLRSSGTQELEASNLSIGVRYHVADNVGLNLGLGYSWYDYEDSGSLVRLEDGATLNSFSESDDDGSANMELGVSYQLNESLGISLNFRYDFDETGANNDSEIYYGSLRTTFAF